MALAATHMRLALDMADRYPVNNFSEFISGTIYPDSRWITGIDRNLTHDDRFLQKDFPKNDFTYGWHVHCLCDHIQSRLYADLFPDTRTLDRQQKWIRLSAAKATQDRHDMLKFDLQGSIDMLNYTENPSGEDIQQVGKFNMLIRETYKDCDENHVPDYYRLWTGVGLEPGLAAKLMDEVKKILSDTRQVFKIESTYAQMLACLLSPTNR